MIPFISTPYGYEMTPLRPSRPRLLGIFLAMMLIITLVLPLPFVIFRPGTPSNVLGKMIAVPQVNKEVDLESRNPDGRLYLTTVFVTTPRSKVFGAEIIDAWIRGDATVYPRSAIYPEGGDPAEIRNQEKFEMTNSQQYAIYNALRYLGIDVKTHAKVIGILKQSDARGKLKVNDIVRSVDGKEVTTSAQVVELVRKKKSGQSLSMRVERDGKVIDIPAIELIENEKGSAIGIFLGMDFKSPVPVSIDIKRTGGPSAGLIFTLGIIEKMTSEDLIRGRKIAGTGTIDLEGRIGAIGGIESKLIGAARIGATIFLAPVSNCGDIKHVPDGLQVIPVATLKEAIEVLRDSDPTDRPSCDSLGTSADSVR